MIWSEKIFKSEGISCSRCVTLRVVARAVRGFPVSVILQDESLSVLQADDSWQGNFEYQSGQCFISSPTSFVCPISDVLLNSCRIVRHSLTTQPHSKFSQLPRPGVHPDVRLVFEADRPAVRTTWSPIQVDGTSGKEILSVFKACSIGRKITTAKQPERPPPSLPCRVTLILTKATPLNVRPELCSV